ncbi:hypothetical protein [Psychroflexus tropicus]|uniref:hypothetical protein n=1 Tax=Psychroflexus tropicus TaxID=197345 RepID=UPI0003A8A99C|nr:hypothetical protein [Psychroflexus tropicus]
MKKKFYILLITFPLWGLGSLSCNSDDDQPQDPIDQLPTMTTTGENTIGCLVNGEPFTDSGLMNNFYQFVGDESVLAINWKQGTTNNSKRGQITIRNLEILEGETYTLNISDFLEDDYTGSSGTFTTNTPKLFGQFETNQDNVGFITFEKFDKVNNIMSGTFQFEAKEIVTNETVSITNGRFDLTFTN